ncbi:phage tail tape measure protein [Sunxiuqinia sp. sy24]|uniref:phage tail tape measure protein n=1 Tax=Sunxiuqinia sp. sy24 TaxID=3461495 RepID=UPI00404568A7
MANSYTRRINLYINGKEVKNNIGSIQAEMRKLINEQKRMTIGSKEYHAHAAKIRSLRGIMKQHQQDINGIQKSWSLKKLSDGFNRYFGLITAGIASLTGIALGFRKAADAASLFEERLDNLSALTGLSGKELEWLGNQAKETSIKTTESGIKIKQSAADILDAYTKVGSQRPELLKNKEALAAVTEDAIILSEAAKMDLEPAVKGLTTTLNQHRLAASESGRVINAMAAGSKEGAADIPYLTEAMEKSGTTMAMMNVKLEDHIGLIEAIAPNYAEARMAGNSLDKVFLKMKANNIGYVDGVFNVNAALDELERRYNSGESAADLFGVEHAKMGELLVQNRSEFMRYSDAVTGTEVAIEQAIKNTNNAAATKAQAMNRLNLQLIEFGEKLNPALIKSTNLVTYFIKALMAAPKWIKDNQVLLIMLGGAVLAYNTAMLRAIATQTTKIALDIREKAVSFGIAAIATARVLAMQAYIAVTGKATVAQRRFIDSQIAFGGAMAVNPITAIVIGLTALIAAMKAYDKYNAGAVAREKEKREATKKLAETNDKLKKTYNDLEGQMSTLSRYSVAEKKDLRDKIDLTIRQAEAELILQEAKKRQIVESNTQSNLWQTFINGVLSAGNASMFAGRQMTDAAINGSKAGEVMDDGLLKLMERIASFKRQGFDLDEIFVAESNADKILNETISGMEEKLNLYNLALKNVKVGSEDFLRIQKKIAATEAELNKAKSKTQVDAADALELAHKQQILSITQFYADKENLDKESKARLLAADLAYYQAQLALEESEEKRLSLQTKILQKQREYTEALKQAVPEIIKTNEATDNLNVKLFEEAKLLGLISLKQAEAKAEMDELTAKLVAQAQNYQNVINTVSDNIFQLAQGGEDAFKTFAKNMLIMALEQLKLQAQMAAVGVTIQSLAMPDSVVTLGGAGLARAAIIIGLIEAAFAGLEGLVSGAFSSKSSGYESGGFTQGEGMYRAGEKGKREWISPNWMLNNPMTGPVIQWLETFRNRPNTVSQQAIAATNSATTTQPYSSAFRGGAGSSISPPQAYSGSSVSSDAINRFDRAIERLEKIELVLSVKDVADKLSKRELRDRQSKL